MNDNSNTRLDRFLRSRPIAPPSTDFSQRIIAAATKQPQQQRLGFYEVMQRLFAEFSLPRPAYAFASLLLIGFITGFSAPELMDEAEDTETAYAQPFLYDEETLL